MLNILINRNIELFKYSGKRKVVKADIWQKKIFVHYLNLKWFATKQPQIQDVYLPQLHKYPKSNLTQILECMCAVGDYNSCGFVKTVNT